LGTITRLVSPPKSSVGSTCRLSLESAGFCPFLAFFAIGSGVAATTSSSLDAVFEALRFLVSGGLTTSSSSLEIITAFLRFGAFDGVSPFSASALFALAGSRLKKESMPWNK